ncbi:hypothetical protein QJS83_06655 [Bdellovibrio sp. 22V]|uniref:hypothetical protein n=1 Tax=Bdellovibrio TaxID=958 RepID=UPI0025427862|nr:hypothetical protein [Bdellovibrio sp. 22V]WII73551.1 hypothetical protein QJS83_06655 [Bdellovibrio sp. 22V]
MRILLALITTLIMSMLTQLGHAHAAIPSVPSCGLASEGIYNGSWVKHRIVVEEDVLGGANDMDSLLAQLENLRSQGLCR